MQEDSQTSGPKLNRPPPILASDSRRGEAVEVANTQITPQIIKQISDKIAKRGPDSLTAAEQSIFLNQTARGITQVDNFADWLPMMFRIKHTQNFCLDRYPPMEAFYDFRIPTKTLLRTGRQVSKSTNLAYKKVYQASTMPNYKMLFVMPLFEQTRRFSQNYVKQAIELAMIRGLIVDTRGSQSVLEKSYLNGSKMTFTYAFRDCDRARGIPADELIIDEVQDMDWTFLPVLQECMSASDWRIESYAGTPKTLDNTICKLWNQSSQGEWIITCRSCRKDNIPSIAEDLLNMIGKTTLCCAKCGYPLRSRDGRWVHRFPDRISDFLGMHVSQPILPLHYESERAWRILRNKIKDQPQRIVYNEVLGEDCDVGAKIIPLGTLIKASCLPFPNGHDDALDLIKKGTYIMVSLGIDWGGRGEDGDSFTALVVIGLRKDGRVDVLFGEKLPPSDDDITEINRISQIYKRYRCGTLGHDFRGVGQAKDSRLTQSGFRHAMPFSNEPASCKFFAKTSRNQTGRVFVQLNRSAGIMLLAHEITHGRMFLPAWPEDTQFHPFLDLNSWYEEFTAQPDGRDLYRIMRSAALPDDVGMALMIAAFTAYRRCSAWPAYMSTLTPEGIVVGDSYTDRSRGNAHA